MDQETRMISQLKLDSVRHTGQVIELAIKVSLPYAGTITSDQVSTIGRDTYNAISRCVGQLLQRPAEEPSAQSSVFAEPSSDRSDRRDHARPFTVTTPRPKRVVRPQRAISSQDSQSSQRSTDCATELTGVTIDPEGAPNLSSAIRCPPLDGAGQRSASDNVSLKRKRQCRLEQSARRKTLERVLESDHSDLITSITNAVKRGAKYFTEHENCRLKWAAELEVHAPSRRMLNLRDFCGKHDIYTEKLRQKYGQEELVGCFLAVVARRKAGRPGPEDTRKKLGDVEKSKRWRNASVGRLLIYLINELVPSHGPKAYCICAALAADPDEHSVGSRHWRMLREANRIPVGNAIVAELCASRVLDAIDVEFGLDPASAVSAKDLSYIEAQQSLGLSHEASRVGPGRRRAACPASRTEAHTINGMVHGVSDLAAQPSPISQPMDHDEISISDTNTNTTTPDGSAEAPPGDTHLQQENDVFPTEHSRVTHSEFVPSMPEHNTASITQLLADDLAAHNGGTVCTPVPIWQSDLGPGAEENPVANQLESDSSGLQDIIMRSDVLSAGFQHVDGRS